MKSVNLITWSDFKRVDIRVGIIVAVRSFPQARKPAYRLEIDFGALGIKKSTAQIYARSIAGQSGGSGSEFTSQTGGTGDFRGFGFRWHRCGWDSMLATTRS